MNKKGFAVMFDWIFSLVAGVLIFSFLIYFAVQHTDLFGKITAKVVGEELDVLFSQYETTETKSVLDFGKKVELEFLCDKNDKKQWFKINDKDGKRLWGKIIFSPKKIKSEKINVATMSWDVPFRVANFIYLWDKAYTISGDIPDVDFLDNFKEETNGDIGFVNDPGLACESSHFTGGVSKVIYHIKDNTHDTDDIAGYICLRDKNGDIQRSFFYGEAMMIGAIFSENYEDFECAKEIAVDKLKRVNEIYREKANILSSHTTCDVLGYNTAAYDENGDIENFNQYFNFEDVRLVKSSNERLISGGCASVY